MPSKQSETSQHSSCTGVRHTLVRTIIHLKLEKTITTTAASFCEHVQVLAGASIIADICVSVQEQQRI